MLRELHRLPESLRDRTEKASVCVEEREKERETEREKEGETEIELKLSIFAGDIRSMAVVSNESKVIHSSPGILDAIRYSSR